ncbi:ceramide synthase 1 [Galendromus occidentalis]|uniref:Ceramide synthase 1 n=1 Tax=Galendromus occidentalis TaxID=34638 RepID=A0AAJ6VZB0_9ACAR|nr:ceramide synthase 1 [Galendromus occidentalis]
MGENSSEVTSNMHAWETMPSYWQLAHDMIEIFNKSINRYQDGSYRFPRDISEDVNFLLNFSRLDLILLLALAVGFTMLRTILSKTIFVPLGRHLKLTEESIAKLPESIWKLLYYGLIASYAFRTVISGGHNRFFQSPSSVWDGWTAEAAIPSDIYTLYVIQGGFYLHGLYALFFQDAWRKDSVMMGIHHMVTISLIWISFVCRYHNIGALVMLFHDFCDVELEFAKVNVYLKVRNGQTHRLNDILAAGSFLAMTVTWFVCRLYYFPLKVLYASSTVLLRRGFIPDYTLLNNTMLLALTAMNLFWFSQMLFLLYKILTGELQEVDDLREYDVVEKLERTSDKVTTKKID